MNKFNIIEGSNIILKCLVTVLIRRRLMIIKEILVPIAAPKPPHLGISNILKNTVIRAPNTFIFIFDLGLSAILRNELATPKTVDTICETDRTSITAYPDAKSRPNN